MSEGRQTSIVGPGPEGLVQKVRDRLAVRDLVVAEVPAREAIGCKLAVHLPVFWTCAAEEDACAEEVYRPVEMIESVRRATGHYPARMVVIAPAPVPGVLRAGTEALATLMRYVSAHLIREQTRINTILCPATEAGYEALADVAFALTSGLLDDMRGQTLHIALD